MPVWAEQREGMLQDLDQMVMEDAINGSIGVVLDLMTSQVGRRNNARTKLMTDAGVQSKLLPETLNITPNQI